MALLIGDVAGHLDALRRVRGTHGVDLATATIPDGLVVVQVGDLVHRSPDSAGVIALVDRFLRGPHAQRWIQLIGNQEQPYLFDQTSVIRRELDERSVETLRAWWAYGLAHGATWDRTTDAPHLNQIHGHTSTREWDQERWWPGADAIINRGDVHADQVTRRELARIGDRLIRAIDPGHQDSPAPMWQP